MLNEYVNRNRSGEPVALASVCSAHPDVLESAMRIAQTRGLPLLIEATSNQVNQYGGYTGMTPADFIAFAKKIAVKVGCDLSRITFGGDHLGPQAWRKEPPEQAMEKAHEMVRTYVESGFTKIHLDCSEGCLGEPAQLDDKAAAARAAQLAETAEKAARNPNTLYYVVGTEVPAPGGTRLEDDHAVKPTSPEAAKTTLEITKAAFEAKGLSAAWARVRGVVVQPGLEFAPAEILEFDMNQTNHLSSALEAYPHIAFEAHSTDYQAPEVFRDLARRNFAVLKVGPALTFALRDALYGLSHIDQWLFGGSHLRDEMERLMIAKPLYWQGHYHDQSEIDIFILRHFGYADRIRYYWAMDDAKSEVDALMERIDGHKISDALLNAYFSSAHIEQARLIQSGGLTLSRALVHAGVDLALSPYMDVAE